MNLLKYENMKLKSQFIFNLPTVVTCARLCPGCYAHKSEVRFKTVLASRHRNFEASKSPDFVARIIKELTSTRRSFKAVRVHESGDYYSQEYIDKWSQIATALPHITFYSFTKRLAHFDFTHYMSLPNVVVIDSLMHAPLNYARSNALLPNVFICPATAGAPVICGVSCVYCQTKHAQSHSLQFIQH